MKIRTRTTSALALAVATFGLAGCDAGAPGPLVAEAADYELTVDETVALLADKPLPNQPQVVNALAELWIDYTLLAHAALEDPTLENVDLEPLVQRQLEQQMIFALRDSVIEADTAVTDEELLDVFNQEAPGVQIRARHILLQVPPGATEEQQDSIRGRAEELRQQAVGGADFAELAQEHSEDPGSASRGGDLGFFDRSAMVQPFTDAAFALEPGEISEVVRTPFGFHVIKLEERQTPDFEEVREQFRAQVQQQRYAQAESAYVAGVEERAGFRITDDALELTRQMARDPQARLSRRAARRPVVEYEGGELTVEEVRSFMLSQSPQVRSQIENANDEIVQDRVINALAQREVLVNEARSLGLETPQAQQDSILEMARERFVEVARELGLSEIQRESGESGAAAVERTVTQMLDDILTGSRDVIPLGAISVLLREEYEADVREAGITAAVERLQEVSPEPQQQQGPPMPPPGAGSTGGAGGGEVGGSGNPGSGTAGGGTGGTAGTEGSGGTAGTGGAGGG